MPEALLLPDYSISVNYGILVMAAEEYVETVGCFDILVMVPVS